MNNLEHQRRLKRLENLVASGGGGGGGVETPLSRYKFIDGGAIESTRNGSPSAAAYKSVTEWLASLGTSTTAADSQAQQAGFVTPCLAGYTENVTFPAYRCTSLLADSLGLPLGTGGVVIQGNAVWNNVAGTNHAPTLDAILEINVPFSGTLTVTDDAVASVIICQSDSLLAGAPFFASIDAHTTTLLASISLIGVSCNGAANLGVNASMSLSNLGQVGGLLTCKFVLTNGAILASVTLPAGNSSSQIANTQFLASPVLTGGPGTIVVFDGVSIRAFSKALGARSPAASDAGPAIVVTGGYDAGEVLGAALPTAADVSVSINGNVGTETAGYKGSNSGNHYVISGLGADHILTALTGGGEFPGDTLLITKTDLAAHLYTVKNAAGTTLGVIPSGGRGFIKLTRVGATAYAGITNDWALAACGSLAA